MGKGRCSASLSPAWRRGQPGQILSQPLSHRHVSGDDDREPLFEGFPLSGEGFDPSVTARQIFIPHAAKCHCLAELAWSSVVSISACTRGSSSYAITSTRTSPTLGFRGLVRCDLLDSLNESDSNHFLQVISLEVQHPDLLFWSDASDRGWGTSLQDRFVLGHWWVYKEDWALKLFPGAGLTPESPRMWRNFRGAL